MTRAVGGAPAARPSLGRGALVITAATAVSRVTGLFRVVAVAAALGTTFLANTYQTANTAPNLLFELVAAGVLTSVFVPTFVEHIVRGRDDEGWRAANALTSVALVALIVLAVILAWAAPWIMRLLLIGVDEPQVRAQSIEVGTDLLRLFAPQVVFYGAGMIMTSALNARRAFALPAIAPIFNNIVVIGVYLSYAALRSGGDADIGQVSTGDVLLLGAGTTAGVIAMTVCLIPGLRRSGWRFRFSFQPSHPAVRRGARLGAWALGYAGGYQAGLIVVLLLANRVEGGVAAYQWAFTFFYLPHALFGVPIFNVLFTAMAEHVAEGEESAVVERLREGLAMLMFLLLPVTVALVVLGDTLALVTLEYGVMTPEGARLVGRTLAAFAVGLPFYSAFLVGTRAFYALSDTRTPALVNAASVILVSVAGALLFLAGADDGWVPGLALGHSAGFLVGAIFLLALLGRRLGVRASELIPAHLPARALAAGAAAIVMILLHMAIPSADKLMALLDVLASGAAGTAVYVLLMQASGSPELARITALIRSVVGRPA